MSDTVKGGWSRVRDMKEFYSCPLWDNIEKRKAAEREKRSNDSEKQSETSVDEESQKNLD